MVSNLKKETLEKFSSKYITKPGDLDNDYDTYFLPLLNKLCKKYNVNINSIINQSKNLDLRTKLIGNEIVKAVTYMWNQTLLKKYFEQNDFMCEITESDVSVRRSADNDGIYYDISIENFVDDFNISADYTPLNKVDEFISKPFLDNFKFVNSLFDISIDYFENEECFTLNFDSKTDLAVTYENSGHLDSKVIKSANELLTSWKFSKRYLADLEDINIHCKEKTLNISFITDIIFHDNSCKEYVLIANIDKNPFFEKIVAMYPEYDILAILKNSDCDFNFDSFNVSAYMGSIESILKNKIELFEKICKIVDLIEEI